MWDCYYSSPSKSHIWLLKSSCPAKLAAKLIAWYPGVVTNPSKVSKIVTRKAPVSPRFVYSFRSKIGTRIPLSTGALMIRTDPSFLLNKFCSLAIRRLLALPVEKFPFETKNSQALQATDRTPALFQILVTVLKSNTVVSIPSPSGNALIQKGTPFFFDF